MSERGSPSLSLGLRAIRRRLSSEPSLVVSLVVTIFIGALALSLTPHLLMEATTQDLVATVSEPDSALRNIRVERAGRLGGPADDPLSPVRLAGEQFATQRMPESIQGVVSNSYFLVDSPQFSIVPLPGEQPPHPFPMFLIYRFQEGVEDHITLIGGELPEAQPELKILLGSDCPLNLDERALLRDRLLLSERLDEEVDCALESLPHYQVAVSTQTAEDLDLEVGRRMMLRPDPTDLTFWGRSGNDLQFRGVMSISGVYDVKDPDAEYWYDDLRLHRPRIRENPDFRIISAVGVMAEDTYGSMLADLRHASRSHTWRYFVDPDLVKGADLGTLAADLAALEARYTPLTSDPTEFRVITQLSDLLAAHEAQRVHTISMMSLSGAWLFGVVVGVVVLLSLVMSERDRRTLGLIRSRGASGGQLTLTGLYEATILTAPAGALGYWIAGWLAAETDPLSSYRISVAFVSAATAAIVVASLPTIRGRLATLQTDRHTPSNTARRAVLDVFFFVLAAGAVVLVRRRGQLDETAGIGFDLLLTVTPTLLGVAAGLLTLRLYPFLVRALTVLASRLQGAVPFLGFRRILQHRIVGRLPVLVILLCVATASYASVTQASISTGQAEASWQQAGADYAIKGFADGVNLPSSLDLEGLGPDVRIALGRSYPSARVEVEAGVAPVSVKAVDAAAYEALNDGTAGDIALSDGLLGQTVSDIGTEAAPLPAIVADTWPSDIRLAVGDTFTLDLERLRVVARVTEVRSVYPDVGHELPFVVIDYGMLQATSDQPLPPTVVYLDAPASSSTVLHASLDHMAPSTRLISRYDILDDIASDPFVKEAVDGLRVVFLFATTLSVVVAVSSLALTADARRRDLSYLRTMGLETSDARLMTVLEQLPALVVGTLAGIVTGVTAAFLLDPALDLQAFTGGTTPAQVTVDWASLGIMAFALIVAMAAAVGIFVAMYRRTEIGPILRAGGE